MTTLLPLFCEKGLSLKMTAYFAPYLEGCSLTCIQKIKALQEHDTVVAVLCVLKASQCKPLVLLLLTHGWELMEYTHVLRTTICF